MRHTSLMFLFILVLIASCKKETVPLPKETSYSSSIQIGGSNVTITDYSNPNISTLDVDNDGQDDLSLSGGYTPGGSLSYIYSAQVTPLHSSISILYTAPNDTVFSGTLVKIEGTPPNVYHTTYNYIGPENKPGTSVYLIENTKYVDYKSANDIIESAFSFLSEPILLDFHHIRQGYEVVSVSNDTTYQQGFYHEANGDYYGNAPFRYVGFKVKTANGSERLGWLKLKVKDYYKVELYQLGIQDPM